MAAAPRGGSRALRPLIILLGLVVIVGAAYVFAGDEIGGTVSELIWGEPEPAPQPAAKPGLHRPQTAAATPAAPAAEPLVTPSQPVSAAAAPVATVPAAPVSGATVAAAAPEPAAPVAAPVAPVASSTEPLKPAEPAEPVASANEAAAPATVAPSTAPATTPHHAVKPDAAQAAKPTGATQSKVAKVDAEADLPAILDRIRQERTKTSLQPSAVVDRGAHTAADSAPTAVAGMVSVEQAPEQVRNDTEQAYDLLLHGQYESALDLYDQALKSTPDSLPALLGKAIALHKLRRTNEARQFYQRVLGLDPNNREALTNITAIIAAEAPTTALIELKDLQKTYPSFSPIPAQIAQIFAASGDIPGALASYDLAIHLSPENGLYRLNLAILQDRAGMAQEAAVSYQAALDRLDASTQLPVPLDTIRARLRYLRSR